MTVRWLPHFRCQGAYLGSAYFYVSHLVSSVVYPATGKKHQVGQYDDFLKRHYLQEVFC